MTDRVIRTRDLRIDLVRGLAMLILFSDHVRGNVVARYTPLAIGLSDMSDVFVFLSGYSCGISYGYRLAHRGFLNCLKRAWSRAAQIYLLRILMTVASLIIFLFAAKWDSPYFFGLPWSMDLVRQHPIESLVEIEMCRLEVFQFFVLSMYTVLILVTPFVVACIVKLPAATFASSACLYAMVQILPGRIALAEPWNSAMYLNPFAWQVLFFSACSLAVFKSNAFTKTRWAHLDAILCIGIVAVAIGLFWEFGGLKRQYLDKRDLGFLRLLHFVFVAIIVASLLPGSQVISRLTFLRPVINCGRFPLVAYCAGGILAIVGGIALAAFPKTWWMQLMINLAGWGGCFGATHFWGRLRRRTDDNGIGN